MEQILVPMCSHPFNMLYIQLAPCLPKPPFPETRAAQPVPRLQQLFDICSDKVKIGR